MEVESGVNFYKYVDGKDKSYYSGLDETFVLNKDNPKKPIQILTQGGPSGSTRTLLYMYYQLGFQEFKMGQATAIAVVMIIITVILSTIQFNVSKKWVNY